MHIRRLVILGLCAAFGLTSAAFAETTTPAKTYLFPSKTTKAADADAKTSTSQKKKLTAKEQAAQKKAVADAKAKSDKKLAAAKAASDKKLALAKAASDKKAAAAAKAASDKKLALAKAAADQKAAVAKAASDRKLAAAKAAADQKLAAKAKAANDQKLAAAKAANDRKLAAAKAEDDARKARELQEAELAKQPEVAVVLASGNTGELRSELPGQKQNGNFFLALFGAKPQPSMLPQTRALDAVLEKKDTRKQFKVKPEFVPQEVEFSGYDAGTIVIDTTARRLYLVESSSTARRYAIAVGREGLQFKGTVAVGDKQEWPRWIPTLDMQKREPQHYAQYKDGMPGGGENPLGARAIYLYDGKKDTHLRIHGTIAPQTIGTSASNGCFRMINEHVMDLYSRVRVGTKVVII